MELRHFRYFAAVARYLNYNEASRRLHIAQPAISKTISDLEEEIGAKLFLRNKRTVRLTAAGTVLLGEAENILKRSDDAKRAAQRAARGEVGILRIGFIAPATVPILPSLVQTYVGRYPDRTNMDEMNVEAVDLGHELRHAVQPGLDLSPVIARLPIVRDFLNRRELDAL